jgi:hypothetical protein
MTTPSGVAMGAIDDEIRVIKGHWRRIAQALWP